MSSKTELKSAQKAGAEVQAGDGLSRREFLQTSGAGLAVSALAPATVARAADNPVTPESASTTTISLTVNGIQQSLEVQDHWTLVELLRDHLQLTGTKIGCNRSECGACTVLVDGNPMYSCSQLAVWMDGRTITTVEGLAPDGQLSPVQQAFVDNNGPQCGFCTPGQLMSATALLSAIPSPDAQQVKQALVGNICRCSNYNAIVEAVVIAGARNGGTA
jgi:aerobic-type carbon monoxide dehydrogenase small subunit (CoxS/CutS family)